MKFQPVATVLFFLCYVASTTVSATFRKKSSVTTVNKSENVMDVTDFSVYYDIGTNKTITTMMPRPWYKPGWRLRLPFVGGPCSCDGFECICCTGIRIQAFKFDRRTCVKMTYDPKNVTLDMDVQMNNNSIYRNSFSAINAPPFCLPIPIPYLPPGLVDMCIRLFDIKVVDQGLHVCMDMDTRVDKAPVLVLHFDCMNMGFNGVSLSKPDSESTVSSDSSTQEPEQVDYDIYDPVTESLTTNQPLFLNSMKYI